MAIGELPDPEIERIKAAEENLDDLMLPAFQEAVHERETPELPELHGAYFETPDTPVVEGAPPAPLPDQDPIGHPGFETPEPPEVAGPYFDGPEPPDNETSAQEFSSPQHETPQPQEAIDLTPYKEPEPMPFLPWAFPVLPTQEAHEEPQPAQIQPPMPFLMDEDPGAEISQPQTQQPIQGPAFDEAPQNPNNAGFASFDQPTPVMPTPMDNEDLFARTGWPVAPPKIASTYWYM